MLPKQSCLLQDLLQNWWSSYMTHKKTLWKTHISGFSDFQEPNQSQTHRRADLCGVWRVVYSMKMCGTSRLQKHLPDTTEIRHQLVWLLLRSWLKQWNCLGYLKMWKNWITGWLFLENWVTLVRKRISELGESKNLHFQQQQQNIYSYNLTLLGGHTKVCHLCWQRCYMCCHQTHGKIRFFSVILCKTLRAAEDAHVPAVKLEFKGTETDLTFETLYRNCLQQFWCWRWLVSESLDLRCIQSSNNCRVPGETIHLMPKNESFQLMLWAIKLQANNLAFTPACWDFLVRFPELCY